MDCKGIHQVPVRFPLYVSVAVVSDAGNWVQSTITVKGCVGVSQKRAGPSPSQVTSLSDNYSGARAWGAGRTGGMRSFFESAGGICIGRFAYVSVCMSDIHLGRVKKDTHFVCVCVWMMQIVKAQKGGMTVMRFCNPWLWFLYILS